jgi:hypothetical protein
VTTQTTIPVTSITQTVTVTPSGYTPHPTATIIKPQTSGNIPTPWPTSTPTQPTPLGTEFCILAIGAGILIIGNQYRKP